MIEYRHLPDTKPVVLEPRTLLRETSYKTIYVYVKRSKTIEYFLKLYSRLANSINPEDDKRLYHMDVMPEGSSWKRWKATFMACPYEPFKVVVANRSEGAELITIQVYRTEDWSVLGKPTQVIRTRSN